MKRLVVNADDYGLSPGVDRGILECVRAGVVTSVSVLVWDRRPPSLPEELIGISGVHLRLTDGKPLANPEDIPTLVGGDGAFLPASVRKDVRPKPYEVRIEWELQVETFKLANSKLTHADSHHHMHGQIGSDIVYEELVAREGVCGVGLSPGQIQRLRHRLKVRCADYAEIRVAEDGRALLDLLDDDFLHHETVQLMVHPGYADETLQKRSKMVHQRQRELEFLLSTRFRAWLQWGGVQLVGMRQL